MLAVCISLAASVLWGTTDFLSGLASRRTGVVVALAIIEGVGLGVSLAAALIVGDALPGAATLAQAAAAGVSAATGLGLFFWALTLGRMSVVAPITACGAILPAVVGLATGDPFSGLLAAGLVSALLGIVLVSLEAEQRQERGGGGVASPRVVALALAGALGLGGYYVLFDSVADHSLWWGLAAARVIPVLVLGGVVLIRRGPAPDARARRLSLGAGVLDVSATALYGVALTQGSLSAVSVVGSLFPLTTVVLARVLLAERLRRVQQLGIALAVLGVAMIAGA